MVGNDNIFDNIFVKYVIVDVLEISCQTSKG